MKGRRRRAHGQVRQSQLVTAYGPGAMIDLPRWAGVIAGLEHWYGAKRQPIVEQRLAQKVAMRLERSAVALFAPPVESDEEFTGVRTFGFPRWFVALYEKRSGGMTERPLVRLDQLTPKPRRYLDRDEGKKWPVVPVRFVQACVNGHLDDIDWRGFVHRWKKGCAKPLWLAEKGTTGDLVDIFVRCECGKRRSLGEGLPRRGTGETEPGEQRREPLGYCTGRRPWLGEHLPNEDCRDADDKLLPAKLLIRTASNSYFAQTLSVIHIPEPGQDLRKALERVWAQYFAEVDTREKMAVIRDLPDPRRELEGFSDDELWQEIQRKGAGLKGEMKPIKHAEMETLLTRDFETPSEVPDGDFYASRLPRSSLASGLMSVVDQVVLVHRLREVRALIGFSRFEAILPDVNGEYPDVSLAPIALEADWVPAVENHGEGFFVSFREEALAAWEERPAVKARIDQLLEGYELAKRRREDFPGARYVMLHSLSHLLITAVSLESGYAAAAIRERIYVTPAGCGILLLTGSPGSEGTLGGLVSVGRKIERHLRAALEYARLCTNDPICAEHEPANKYEERFRHGAACHGCLLIAEPSCEKFNVYLDRALVVPTVKDTDCAFFRGLL